MLILRKIVEMADGLGVSCICEGVETKEQEIFLKEIGCRYAQGYLYSKPMPSKEFIDKYVSK
jgi:sensor c-di-GMP phosphodiesterase-like protein